MRDYQGIMDSAGLITLVGGIVRVPCNGLQNHFFIRSILFGLLNTPAGGCFFRCSVTVSGLFFLRFQQKPIAVS